MERTCQFSYPLNSANASPPGTFTVYLSWADKALPPNALTSAVTIAIVPKPLLFITGSSFVNPLTALPVTVALLADFRVPVFGLMEAPSSTHSSALEDAQSRAQQPTCLRRAGW